MGWTNGIFFPRIDQPPQVRYTTFSPGGKSAGGTFLKEAYMLIVIIVAAILVVDQITKALAVKLLTQLPAYTYPLWQDVFHLTYTENRGAAFGMLQGGRWFFIVATVVVCGGVIWFLYKDRKRMHLLMKISLALILGGALGNFIDRVWLGYVRDMFSAVIFNFAIFNVADMALSIGCGLLFLDLLFLKGKDYFDQPKPQSPDAGQEPDANQAPASEGGQQGE